MTDDQFQKLFAGLAEVRREVREVRGVAEHSTHGLYALQHRMDGMQNRMDGVEASLAEVHRHFDIVAEGLEGQIQLVAEGLIGLGERIEGGRRETATELSDIKALIRVSYSDLDRRVNRLEEASGM